MNHGQIAKLAATQQALDTQHDTQVDALVARQQSYNARQTDDVNGPAQPAPRAKSIEEVREEERHTKDQAEFDAIKAGPFTPEALSTAAQAQYARRLPDFLTSTEAQIKQAAAMGADVIELNTAGAMNYHVGVKDWLTSLGFEVAETDPGEKTSRLAVFLYGAKVIHKDSV